MSTWKQEHVGELVGRQAHISQKLAQLRAMLAPLQDMRQRLPQMITWLKTFLVGPTGVREPMDLFNPEVFARLGSIGVFARTGIGQVQAAGAQGTAPAAAGATSGTAGSSGDAAQQAHASQVFGVFDGVGLLGTQVSLGNFTDEFGITGRIDDGVGWLIAGELWNTVTSPFTTYQRHKFTFRAQSLMEDLMENHGDNITGLGGALIDSVSALERLNNALNSAAMRDLENAAEGLESVLNDMNSIYDQAGGGGPSSGELAAAAQPPDGFFDVVLDPMQETTGATDWATDQGCGVTDWGSFDAVGGGCDFPTGAGPGLTFDMGPGFTDPALDDPFAAQAWSTQQPLVGGGTLTFEGGDDIFGSGSEVEVRVDSTVTDPAGNTVDSGDDEASTTAS